MELTIKESLIRKTEKAYNYEIISAMTIITITQSLFSSLKRSITFVEKFPTDCQITIILAAQTLESFFNELAIIKSFIEQEYITSQIETLCEILSELEESKGSLKLKLINTEFILNGSKEFKSSTLYENFNLLISLRNRIVHPKPTKLTDSIENDRLFKSFHSKKLTDFYDQKNKVNRSSLYYVMNPKVAYWALETVKDIIIHFIDSLPNKESQKAMGIVRISLLEIDELKKFIDENDIKNQA